MGQNIQQLNLKLAYKNLCMNIKLSCKAFSALKDSTKVASCIQWYLHLRHH